MLSSFCIHKIVLHTENRVHGHGERERTEDENRPKMRRSIYTKGMLRACSRSLLRARIYALFLVLPDFSHHEPLQQYKLHDCDGHEHIVVLPHMHAVISRFEHHDSLHRLGEEEPVRGSHIQPHEHASG